jgi:hypothetical protein
MPIASVAFESSYTTAHEQPEYMTMAYYRVDMMANLECARRRRTDRCTAHLLHTVLFAIELFPSMLLVLFELGFPLWPAGIVRHATICKDMHTYNTGTRGSMSARCCMLKNRSLKRLPSGFRPLRLSVRSSPSWTSILLSGTTCLPNLWPARPLASRSCSSWA